MNESINQSRKTGENSLRFVPEEYIRVEWEPQSSFRLIYR